MRKRPTPETDAFSGNMGDCIKFAEKLERERNEAREAFIEARKHREQFNSLLQSYEACWEEIKTALGEPEKGDQTCDLDRVLKAIRERDEARELVKVYQEYTKLIVDEISDTAAVAYVHGWRTNRYEEGKVLRDKIKRLEETK